MHYEVAKGDISSYAKMAITQKIDCKDIVVGDRKLVNEVQDTLGKGVGGQ